MNDIPDWAFEKAAALTYNDSGGSPLEVVKVTIIGRAFAKYIVENEQPSVDPDIAIAQEYYDKWLNDDIDSCKEAILAAIKASKA